MPSLPFDAAVAASAYAHGCTDVPNLGAEMGAPPSLRLPPPERLGRGGDA
jgi:hypothetical protein